MRRARARAHRSIAVGLLALSCGDDGSSSDADSGDTMPATDPTITISESTSSTDTETASATNGTESTDTGATTEPTGTAGTTGQGAVIDLDPDTLEWFALPIGSLRYAVAGQDKRSNTCVSLIWNINAMGGDPLCAQPDMADWPYVVVTPDTQAPCMQWDYEGNVTVDDAQGCVQFVEGMPLIGTVDVTLEVSGGPFTGTIIAKSP